MSSEKRREANRANARKSTGPKTEAGKQKSRRNALKHGLSGAGVVMRRTDEKKLVQRIEDFKEILAPINRLEENLVERAALAAVRCESAVRQEAAERRRRISKALNRLEAKKRKKISEIVELLEAEPGVAGRKLRKQKRGIAWLIAEWRKLAERLEGQGFWNADEACRALRMLGKDPALPYPDDASVHAFRKAFLAALPVLVPEEAECLLGLDPQGLDDTAREAAINASLPEPADARNTLRTIAAEAIERLKQRRGRLKERRRDKLERAEAVACAEVGTDIQAARLHQYERQQELSLHRNLNELIKIRKQEPELASIARWEKTGKKYNRRWDGYAWVPNSEWRVPEDGEELKTMTDDRWLMTEQTADSGSDRVSHPSSVISHSSSAPVRHQPSVISHPGVSPTVWPGLSETCPGLLPKDPGLEEAAGLMAQEPVTASGGSLRSTPGTRSESHPEEQEADLPADDDVKVSGASLRSAPGTRSESVLEEGKTGLVADGHGKVTGASADALAPATLSCTGEEEEDPGLPANGCAAVSGASLCSAPGTRPDAEERAASLPSQPTPRVAGFSALREPGPSEAKQEPVPGLPVDEAATAAGASPGGLAPATPNCGEADEKTMTNGRWLMTEQTGRAGGQLQPAEPGCESEPLPVSHQSSVISHPWGFPASSENEASAAAARQMPPATSEQGSGCQFTVPPNQPAT